MKKEETRFASSTVMEGMTSISSLLAAREAKVNDRPIDKILFDRERKRKKEREYSFLEMKCRALHIPLELVEASEIDALTVGNTHGGIIALCGERTLPHPTAENLPKNAFLCLLEGIEDPYNFGYALRSLYAAGVDAILLGERNWLSAAGVVARASAGASEALPLFAGNIQDAVALCKQQGYRVVCAGIRDAVGLYEADLKKPLLLVVGGEKRGISAEMLSLADQVVRIDYGREFRGSLSAASAATVIAFEVLHQNK
jgi:23S rRNA (guanosine2251-2'-O)-methyltransferase